MNKHKKIAIYISENKFIGGAHQYTENLIIALSKLPKNKFKLFAIFQDGAHNFKLNKRFKKIYIKENNLQKVLYTQESTSHALGTRNLIITFIIK